MPRRRTVCRARFALLALTAALGCGDVPSVLGESYAIELAPGAWAEAELAMATGDVVEVDFDSGGVELVWDVHSHEASLAVIHDEGVDAAHLIAFEAPETRRYWVMWTNHTDTAAQLAIDFRFHGSAALTGWYP